MAARRRKEWRPLIRPEQAIGLVVAAGILTVVLNNLSAFFWAIIFCVGGLLGFLAWRRSSRKTASARLENRLADLIERHESALISYYHQTRREDLFGNRDETRWHQQIDTFLKTQLVPEVADFAAWRRGKAGQHAASGVDRMIRERIASHGSSRPLATIDVHELTPTEYEHHCADMLRERGWAIQLTPASRDGGADFVAEKSGIRIVFQCKRYSQPVGNKAVQEVTSAVRLYHGNVACVVAPNGYTRQAQREATGLSVHLLHHSALPAFVDRLAGEPSTIPVAAASEQASGGGRTARQRW